MAHLGTMVTLEGRYSHSLAFSTYASVVMHHGSALQDRLHHFSLVVGIAPRKEVSIRLPLYLCPATIQAEIPQS